MTDPTERPAAEINPHAAALGALGAAKGGRARAESLSSDQRAGIARDAAVARWSKDGTVLPKAVFGSAARPLRVGKIEIPCYVLDNGDRVLVQRGMISALDMAQGTAAGGMGDRLVKFARTKGLAPFVTESLADQLNNPIKFRAPNGSVAYGYPATILADFCEAILEARKEGKLHPQQVHIAERAEILVRGFARTGIIALVDEATGYQEVRARNALAEILELFIADELRKWVRTFPPDFYQQMYRLKGWDYSAMKPNSPKPLTVGRLTDDLVYKRIAPGVREELRRLVPRTEKGYRKAKLHQHLTEEVGHPKLREHLSALVALMKISEGWSDFMKHVNKVLPRFDRTLELPLND